MNWFDITSRLVVVVVVNFSEADVIAEYAGDGGDCGRTMVSLSFCCSSSAIRLTATVVFIGLMRDKKKHIRGCNEQKILTSIPITWDRELDYGWTIMIQSNFNQLFHWLSWHYWWWLLVMMMMMMMTMTTMVVVTIFTTTAMTIYVYIYSKKKNIFIWIEVITSHVLIENMNMNVNTKINGIKQMTLTVLYIQGKEREREGNEKYPFYLSRH